MSKNQIARIRLASLFQDSINRAVRLITEMAKKTGAVVNGPVLLPNRKKKITVLSSPNVDKDARDQLESTEHYRLLIIHVVSAETMNALTKIDLPPEVFIVIK